ncbi:MAG: pilus assembly protein, partial [Proteobacteria bacterium]|nr:pilus assembly protein [Pseudomonadota bacterium]
MKPCLHKSCPGPLAGDNALERAGAAIRGAGGGALRTLGAFARDTSGATAVMLVLLIPVLIGFMGISVDVGLWYTARRGMQNMADAAAMSGASEIANGSADSIVLAAAQSSADSNGFDATDGSVITINVPPEDGPNAGNDGSVEVIISRPMALLFTEAFSTLRGETFSATATVRAVANTNFVDEFCILGLDPTQSKAVEVSGTGQLTLDCGIAVNSDASNALSVSGTAVATVTSVTTVGEVSILGNGDLDSAAPPRRGAAVEDPYDDLDVPTFSDCDEENTSGGQGQGQGGGASSPVQVNGNKTFDASTGNTPGIFVICGGLKVNAGANVTFEPGVYIIDGGDFDIGGQSTVVGDGVTFILTGGTPGDIGSVKIVGGSTGTLTAPDSDPLNA